MQKAVECGTRFVGAEIPADVADELKVLAVRLHIPQKRLLTELIVRAVRAAAEHGPQEALQLSSPFGDQ